VKRLGRGPLLWIIVVALLLLTVTQFVSAGSAYKSTSITTIMNDINGHHVRSATVQVSSQYVQVVTDSGQKLQSDFADNQGIQLVDALSRAGVTTVDVKITHSNVLLSLLINLLPFALLAFIFFFFMNQMQGGGSRVMNFGKSRAKLVSKDTPKTTFADVAGADEAIEELEEIKEFLENPAKFQAIGAKIPKGVLLYGPPGTGKTLLARAVAGEAGVPFYSISGSDFVEMFVGVGASRVRDLFEQAKANAPAIIFVDEIDAVGRHRGAGLGGGHDEREQTLNQMLVEMDGFDVRGGVILIAATNRPDILDPALLRPGRFDRQIAVDRPDLIGRRGILDVHSKGKPLGPDVDLQIIARRTPGFTGADLANVVNEAALLTARCNERVISGATLEEAIDRVVAGPQRRTRVMSDKEKKVTAYHESGHALVAHSLPNIDPVHKVTILPRGRALGYTMVLPEEDSYSQTKSQLLDTLAYALGGRAAEELVFHDPTTGAANDIEKATATARAMVTQFGMSDRLGALKFGQESGEVFLGRDMGHQRDYSEEVAAEIDEEVRGLVEAAHDEAFEILSTYRNVLDEMVLRLLDKETLNKTEVLEIFASVQKRAPRAFPGTGKRQPSSQGPVLTPAELALLGPGDVPELAGPANGGTANGGTANGGETNGGAGNGNGKTSHAGVGTGSAARPSPRPSPSPRASSRGAAGGGGEETVRARRVTKQSHGGEAGTPRARQPRPGGEARERVSRPKPSTEPGS